MDWTRIQPRRALRGTLAVYSISVPRSFRDAQQLYAALAPELYRRIEQYLSQNPGVKVQLCAWVKFFKPTTPKETTTSYFWTRQTTVLRGDSPNVVSFAMQKLYERVEKFLQMGSGWVIEEITRFEVHFAKYQPLRGGCIENVELPECISSKKATTNIKCHDDYCLKWCYLAHKHPVQQDPNRVTKYQRYEDEVKTDGLRFPLPVDHVPKFEALNSISINVYGFDTCLIPLYISQRTDEDHMDVLLYQGHYCLVRHLDRLLSDQRGGHRRKFFCHRCLHPFYTEARRNEHSALCINKQNTRVEVPEDGHIEFRNIRKMLRRPVVVYGDIETLQEEDDTQVSEDTKREKVHVPSGYAAITNKTCCHERKFENPVKYRGKDCVNHFLQYVLGTAVIYHHDLDNIMDVGGIDDGEDTVCHICKDDIADPNDRVRDHCHLCGQYRGPAHNRCNLQLQLDQDIIVDFHNLRKFDSHLIIKEMGAVCEANGLKITCVAKSIEDYLTFSIVKHEMDGTTWKIKFIDSYQFMSTSLEALADNLEEEHFHALREVMGEHWRLFTQKQAFPYDKMTGWDVFDRTDEPTDADFDTKLKGSVSKERIAHFRKIWRALGIKNWGHMHDTYVTADVLIQHDVCERFRDVCLETYGLDPFAYITLPSFSWDACLKMTKVKLELITDIDMYCMFEQSCRGGISVISHRSADANNDYLDNFNPALPPSYLMYFDVNNLYGAAMTDPLPVRNFRWLTSDEISAVDWANHPADHRTGYVLEVDLDYPAEIHDATNEYPLAPEHLTISDDMLSPYCAELKRKLDLTSTSARKLAPNLLPLPKKRYVVHYRNLQYYVRKGIKVTAIHRVIAFDQEPWIKPYVELNTRLRRDAKSEFEKALYKLMVNAIFGKTMQNVRKYKEVHLVTNEEQFIKLVANPRYKGASIFSDNLVGVLMAPKVTKLDKPIYDGFTVLETSKLRMFAFHYDFMKPKYGDDLTLCLTDTDSFLYHVKTPDIYVDMAKNIDIFDTSNYPAQHPLYSTANKKQIGKMSDETGGEPIKSFVGLKSKMYAFKFGDSEVKKAKGITKQTVKTQMSFDTFANCLHGERNNPTKEYHTMHRIQSSKHTLYTMEQTKLSLTAFDDKRFILNDGISTRAYGHWKNGEETLTIKKEEIID